ncbi:phosphoglycerate mutase-like protein [Ascodesmis nigricans]|uniref:Phosphoglycerate mutase-like protein n=1 Tax=Ascodesmis nigricans TaxID=341454 RepID=A0A4S2MX23_9PEZI|nr:phosphoglycerate mutase-like protein [Ascodesmis nigricans]
MLETIYIARHGFRSNWTTSPTGVYTITIASPTGIPNDPPLTAHGVKQAKELAEYVSKLEPKVDRIYSSPFYRCIQTINPLAEALDKPIYPENGIAEWFGLAPFSHPSPASPTVLHTFYPRVLTPYSPVLIPPSNGESLAGIHDRVALSLTKVIAAIDRLHHSGAPDAPKTIILCAHAAPNIAMGRVLTGDENADIRVGTCSLSEYRRKKVEVVDERALEETGKVQWKGKGVAGGWTCVRNGDCSFLKNGEERNWWFDGEESWDFPVKEESGAVGGPGTVPVAGKLEAEEREWTGSKI